MSKLECQGIQNWVSFAAEFKRMPLVYSIHNIRNFKFYIGQTHNLYMRCDSYRKDFRRGTLEKKEMYSDYQKHGEDAFLIRIEEFDISIDQLKVREKEIYDLYIGKFGEENCYNQVSSFNISLIPEIPPERFWRFVDVTNPDQCWMPLRPKKSKYPTFRFGVQGYKYNRVAYVLERRKQEPGYQIPYGVLVRHICNNKHCSNPKHLTLGGDVENKMDLRLANTSKAQKITIDDVNRIRELGKKLRGLSEPHKKVIASQLGIDFQYVRKILVNKAWYDENYFAPKYPHISYRIYRPDEKKYNVRAIVSGEKYNAFLHTHYSIKDAFKKIEQKYLEFKEKYGPHKIKIKLDI